jgi:V/A-type H+-transporting ATPase subunit E
MNGMESINSAIREKVNVDAQAIIKDAEERAGQRVASAKEQQRVKLESDKNKLVGEAQVEVSRIQAQGAIRARQEMLSVKTSIIDGIIAETKKQLMNVSGSEKILTNLTREGIKALGTEKVRVYVAEKDVPVMQKLVREDTELGKSVTEVKNQNILGGVIIEDINGKNRIDNTFESRLEMLLPKLLPQIEKELS